MAKFVALRHTTLKAPRVLSAAVYKEYTKKHPDSKLFEFIGEADTKKEALALAKMGEKPVKEPKDVD